MERILVRTFYGTFFVCLIASIIMTVWPSESKRSDFVYGGKTYTNGDPQQNNVQLTPEQEQSLREVQDRCRVVILRSGARYVCD